MTAHRWLRRAPVALLALLTCAFYASSVRSQPVTAPPASPAATSTSESTAQPTTSGEIRKIDRINRKLTIKHGEIDNLGMAAMTMVFVAPPSVRIDDLKAGDKIRFVADIKDGALAVTRIEPSTKAAKQAADRSVDPTPIRP